LAFDFPQRAPAARWFGSEPDPTAFAFGRGCEFLIGFTRQFFFLARPAEVSPTPQACSSHGQCNGSLSCDTRLLARKAFLDELNSMTNLLADYTIRAWSAQVACPSRILQQLQRKGRPCIHRAPASRGAACRSRFRPRDLPRGLLNGRPLWVKARNRMGNQRQLGVVLVSASAAAS